MAISSGSFTSLKWGRGEEIPVLIPSRTAVLYRTHSPHIGLIRPVPIYSHTLAWSNNYSHKNTTNIFFSPKWLVTYICNWTLCFVRRHAWNVKTKAAATHYLAAPEQAHLRSSKAENTSSNILPGVANTRHVAQADNRTEFKYRHASKTTDRSSVYIKNLP